MKRMGLVFLVVLMAATGLRGQSTPPSGAQVETWSITYSCTDSYYGDLNDTESMAVAFSGSDVYFNFPNTVTGKTWMKGTIDGSVATFEKGQLVGQAPNGVTYYYMGVQESALCDIVFTYDEANGIFVLNGMYLALNSSLTNVAVDSYFSMAVITRNAAPDSESEKDYVLTGKNVNPNDESQYEELNENVKVSIDGTSIAIQGLSAFDPSAWLTGTVSNGVATFAKRQSAGSYNNTPLYMIGYDGSECDISFSFDSTSGVLVGQQYILCVTEEGYTYQILQDLVLTPQGGDIPTPQPEVVVPPAGIALSSYVFTANKMQTDDEGNYSGYEEVKRNVKVGFTKNNLEVYVRGFCEQLPEAWVKGTISDGSFGDKTVTFAAGQYYGQYGLYPLYMAARRGDEFTNMVFNYDPQTREFQNDGGVYLVLNLMPSQPAPVEQYVTVRLTPGSISGIQGVTADNSSDGAWYSIQGVRIGQPRKGIYIQQGKKVIVR